MPTRFLLLKLKKHQKRPCPITLIPHNYPSARRLDGEREGNGPSGNLLLEAVDLLDLTASNLGLEVLELVGLLGQLGLDLLAQLDARVNVGCDFLEVFLAEAARCHGGRADTDAHG